MKTVWVAVTRQRCRGTDFPEIVDVEVFDKMEGAEEFIRDFLTEESDYGVVKSATFEQKEVRS